MRAFEYVRPASLAEASSILNDRGESAKVMAGGIALLIVLKQRLFAPEVLVDVKSMPELDRISTNGELRIGAVATHRRIEQHPAVRADFPVIAKMAAHVANVQVRNKGTLGGNLCQAEPASDPGTVLLAHDARVRLVSANGDRTLSLSDFFVDYYETAARSDEILTDVLVPYLPSGMRGLYFKFTPRSFADKPAAGVALLLKLDAASGGIEEARIALANCGPTPIRCRATEDWLLGRTVDEQLAIEAGHMAASEARPIDDIRASAEYRRHAIGVLVKRALLELAASEGEQR